MTSLPDTSLTFSIGKLRCTALADADQGARNVLLIETDDKLVLVDAGAGRAYSRNPGRLLDRLAMADFDPDAVDAVIFSHGDFDHIGGAMDEDRPTFPNADHFISRAECDFWRGAPDRLPASPAYDEDFRTWGNQQPLKAIAVLEAEGRLHPVEFGRDVIPNISMVAAPGHTPGNAVIRIATAGEALLVVADLLYQPENIENPDWVSPYDYDPSQVVVTRRTVLAKASAENALLMAYHVPFPGLGRVMSSGKGWKWAAWVPSE